MGDRGVNKYLECQHIPTALVEEITEAQALNLPERKIEAIYPLFEQKISDYKRMKLCSLELNELLNCRWKNYLSDSAGLKVTPFEFPKLCDLHFHNNSIKFMPSLSSRNWQNVRMQMGIGPGIDTYGQIPIPQIPVPMDVSKSTAKTKAKPAKCAKTKPVECAKIKSKPVEYTKAKQQ